MDTQKHTWFAFVFLFALFALALDRWSLKSSSCNCSWDASSRHTIDVMHYIINRHVGWHAVLLKQTLPNAHRCWNYGYYRMEEWLPVIGMLVHLRFRMCRTHNFPGRKTQQFQATHTLTSFQMVCVLCAPYISNLHALNSRLEAWIFIQIPCTFFICSNGKLT